MKKRIRVTFRSKYQLPWIMIFTEYIENGDLVFAKLHFCWWPDRKKYEEED